MSARGAQTEFEQWHRRRLRALAKNEKPSHPYVRCDSEKKRRQSND
jgi:hypothetical protein